MNENKGMNIMRWAVGLLVLCNIGLVVTIWLKPHYERPPKRESPQEFVVRSLKFTDDQAKKYDVLVKEHQQQMHRLRDESAEARKQLFGHLKTRDYANRNSNPFVDSLTGIIALKQRQIEQYTYYHFAAVRELCTKEQKDEFDKIIIDVTRMMAGPGGHRPPHDGVGGDPDGPPPPGEREGPPPLPGGADLPPPPDGR